MVKLWLKYIFFAVALREKLVNLRKKKKMKFVFTCKHRVFQLLVVFFATVEVLWKFCGKSQVIL